jgi:hypothetical protein
VKIVNATLRGEPAVGDVVMLHYCAPRGGRTTAGHVVLEVEEPLADGLYRKRPQNLDEIVDAVAKSGEMQYCGSKNGTPSFRVLARGKVVRVECKDEVEDVTFVPEIKAHGGGSIEIELIEL